MPHKSGEAHEANTEKSALQPLLETSNGFYSSIDVVAKAALADLRLLIYSTRTQQIFDGCLFEKRLLFLG